MNKKEQSSIDKKWSDVRARIFTKDEIKSSDSRIMFLGNVKPENCESFGSYDCLVVFKKYGEYSDIMNVSAIYLNSIKDEIEITSLFMNEEYDLMNIPKNSYISSIFIFFQNEYDNKCAIELKRSKCNGVEFSIGVNDLLVEYTTNFTFKKMIMHDKCSTEVILKEIKQNGQ